MASSVKKTVTSDPAFTVQLSDGEKSLDFGGVTTVASLFIRAASSITITVNGSIIISGVSLRLAIEPSQVTSVTVSTSSVSPVSVVYTLVE